jgi:hypothetical protein
MLWPEEDLTGEGLFDVDPLLIGVIWQKQCNFAFQKKYHFFLKNLNDENFPTLGGWSAWWLLKASR